jgi:predicted enzyme related to lactoylglutathione lyase
MTARHVLTILAVSELGRTLRFYDAAFGWSKLVETPAYVELDAGGQRFGLYQREGFAKNTSRAPSRIPDGEIAPTEIYLHVDDLERAIERLRAAGARELSPRQARDWGDEAAYFADPDGNVVVLARPILAGTLERPMRPRV